MSDDILKRLVELPAKIRMGISLPGKIRMGTKIVAPVEPAPDAIITQHGKYIKMSHYDWYKDAWETSQKQVAELEYALEAYAPNHYLLDENERLFSQLEASEQRAAELLAKIDRLIRRLAEMFAELAQALEGERP